MDDHVVPFNVPMSAAHRGQVADPIDHAFTGDLATREKASIRIGVREEIVLQAGRKATDSQHGAAPTRGVERIQSQTAQPPTG